MEIPIIELHNPPPEREKSRRFCLYLRFKRGSVRLSVKICRDPLELALICFFLLLIASYLFSPYKSASFEELMRYTSYFALYLLVTRHVQKERQVKILLFAMILTTAVTTVYGLCQRLGYDFALWDIQGRIFSTFGHPNFFANSLLIMIPTFIGVFIAEATSQGEGDWTPQKQLLRLSLIVLIIGAVLCLLFTLSRGAFLGLAMAFPFFVFLVVRYLLKQIRIQKFWLCALALLIFIAVAIVVLFDPMLKRRVASSFELKTEVTGSNEARGVIWEAGLRMFAAKPVFGHGLGTFQLKFPQYRPSDYARKGVSHNTLHAHSEYLEIATEMGIIGLIAFFCVLFCYFFFSIRALNRLKGDDFSPIVIGLLSGVFAASTHNLISVSLRWTAAAVPFWFAFALTVAIVRVRLFPQNQRVNDSTEPPRLTPTDRTNFSRLVKSSAYLLLLCLFLSLLFLIACDFISSVYLARANLAFAEKQWKETAKAAFISKKFHPFNLEAHYKLAYAYGRLGRVHEAIAIYQQLQTLEPDFAQIHYNLGGAYEALGQYDKAIVHAQEAVKQNDGVTAHFLLATLFFKTEKWEQAIKAYKHLRALSEGELLRRRLETLSLPIRFRMETAEQYKTVQQAEMRALLNQGDAHKHLNQWRKAQECYETFLDLYPHSEFAESAKNGIILLQKNADAHKRFDENSER